MHIIYASHVICNIDIVYNNVRNVYNNVRNARFTNMLTNILLVSYLCHIVTICAHTQGMYTICKCTRNSIHAHRQIATQITTNIDGEVVSSN